MAEKPSYLRLLNGVANAEWRAHVYLSAWADVTPDPEVRQVLLTVAAREGEHGMSFAKRVNELGFELEETEDANFEKTMEIVTSDRTDLEKIDAIGLNKYMVADGEPDLFDNFFRDHTIDIQTGELLGRYIAEERDTLRLLTGCCAVLTARANGNGSASADRLATLETKIDTVCNAVEELRQIVTAQAPATNGKPARAAKAGAK
jgi:rubrerythrin